MITRVVLIGLQRLRHNPVELLLAVVVPVVFFTIFALIFDRQLGSGKTKPIRVATVDIDGSTLSGLMLDRVAEDDLVLHQPVAEQHGVDAPAEAYRVAGDRVLRGEVALAVVAPEGWAESLATPEPIDLWLLADTSDPVAPRMIESVLQRSFGEARAAGARRSPRASRSDTGAIGLPAGASLAADAAAKPAAGVGVRRVDLLGKEKANPVVSMYAAGIAVMFLLFSATGNAGSLLDEEENQTLERLMCSRLGMTHLLLGKWLLLGVIGVTQVTVMFVWAQLVFGVDLTSHLPGFMLMTLATVSASASLALVLAAACKSRGQLNAVSVILILSMSALGGSMVPRYLMSDAMQEAGRLTFNAWAIDGYTKLFWRDMPIVQLLPELAVLGGSAVVLLLVARLLARRWEVA